MTTVDDTWAREFFTGLFVEIWLAAVPPEQTKTEADYLEAMLQAPPGGSLLDLACGGGRHTCELTSRGYQLTGVDLSNEFLAHARKSNPAINWEQRPITDLPWQHEFDGAYCMGNSLGGLDDAAHSIFFHAVAKSLKPGARFILETGIIAESILPTVKDRPWWQMDERLFLVSNTYDVKLSRLLTEFTILKGSRTEKKAGFSQVYTLREFLHRLEAAGFGEFQLHASTDKDDYKLGSHNLLLVAKTHA